MMERRVTELGRTRCCSLTHARKELWLVGIAEISAAYHTFRSVNGKIESVEGFLR